MYLPYSKLREMIVEVRSEYEELYNSERPHLKKTGYIGLRAIDKVHKNIKDSIRKRDTFNG
jgi:hypothetical protein